MRWEAAITNDIHAGLAEGKGGRRSLEVPAAKWRRVLAAGMLGAAVFLIQAGAVEIALRNDRLCREARSDNWAVNPKGCQTESVLFLLRGLSYGVVGIVRPGLPALGILSMALVMGAVAASLAFLPARHAIPIFLIVEVMAASVFGAIAFLAFFVG